MRTVLFPSHFILVFVISLWINNVVFGEIENQSTFFNPFKDQLINQPLDNDTLFLIDAAFNAASKIPIEPHIKDRSKTQEKVVQACLQLNQSKLALEYTQRIENWRKGVCLADIAFYCAEHDIKEPIEPLIKEAEKIALDTEDWRIEQIRVKIGNTYALLENYENVINLEGHIVAEEKGKILQVEAKQLDDESYDDIHQYLQTLIVSGNFDTVKNALTTYAELYNRFYDNIERRTEIIQTIKDSWKPLPILYRIEVLQKLSDTAINHSDTSKALQLLDDVEAYINAYQFPLETHIPLCADLSKSLYRAGEKQHAIALAEKSLALYQEKGKQIVNIWRAGALRPLAEAFHIMGGTEKSLHVYKLAIEEGMENPNSRPRAEDLSSTCISMALHNFKSDEQLWTRIQEIQKGLSAPW